MENCPDHEICGSLWPLDPAALVSSTHLTFRTQTQTRRHNGLEEEERTDIAETLTPLCKSGRHFEVQTQCNGYCHTRFLVCVEHRGESHSHIIKSHATPIRRRDPLIWARQPAPFSWLDANGGWACEVAPCWALFFWIVSVDSLLMDSKATWEPFSSTLYYLMWFYFPSVTSCLSPDPCADGSFLCFYPNVAQFCWPLMLNTVSVVFICAENGRVGACVWHQKIRCVPCVCTVFHLQIAQTKKLYSRSSLQLCNSHSLTMK